MIDVKQAIANVSEFFAELFPKADLELLRLEEVELTDDEKHWFITMSFPRPGVYLGGAPREYKTFKVGAVSGRVISMTIRQLQ